jgi:hypothetical protein
VTFFNNFGPWFDSLVSTYTDQVDSVLCCAVQDLFCFILFCFDLFCFVLFRFVLFCFVLFCFVLFCFVLFCFVLFCFILLCSVMFCYVLLCYVLFCYDVVCCLSVYHLLLVTCHLSTIRGMNCYPQVFHIKNHLKNTFYFTPIRHLIASYLFHFSPFDAVFGEERRVTSYRVKPFNRGRKLEPLYHIQLRQRSLHMDENR